MSSPQSATQPFLSQATQGDDGGCGSHFTLALGTQSGTDAPSDISTLEAWLSGILEWQQGLKLAPKGNMAR